ncbi:hypothetical protein OsI_36005 [Oryza sativa Indica Group]|jgi:hypothetical protein|uniref:Uncharacterized protein n=1 Tax=Oryza sativa subsp. indica TaxID=39946 RepID=B8BKC2_ORYSI|nr:hypothetical protein OsI_36005 [Oryza sativa Indica Group]
MLPADGRRRRGTASVDADGAELLKLALDGTRPQVEALLARLRPDVVLFDFVTPWVADAARRLGVRSARFSIFPAVSGAYFMAHGRGLYGARPTAEELASAPEGFPPSSPLSTVPTYQAAHFTHIFTSFHGMPSTHDRSVACHNACDALVIRTCHEMEGPTSTTSRRSMASRCSPRGHWCRSHREASWRRGSRRGSPPSRTRPSSSPWTNIE